MPGSIRACACNEPGPSSLPAEEMARPRPHADGAARGDRRTLARGARSPPPRILAEPQTPRRRPPRTDFAQSLKPPGAAGHVLGTDQLGRDLLARVLHGARLALFIGGCTVVL